MRSFEGQMGSVSSIVQFGTDSVITASTDGSLRQFDVNTCQVQRSFSGHNQAITALSMSSDNRFLYSASLDQTIRQWDLITGTQTGIQTGIVATNNTRAMLLAGPNIMYTASSDGMVSRFNISEFGIVRDQLRRRAHTSAITAMILTGSNVITASHDTTVKVLHGVSLNVLSTMSGHVGAVMALALDGDTIYSSSLDSTVRSWSVATGQLIKVFKFSAAFSSNSLIFIDTFLVAGDDQGRITQFSLLTGHAVMTLETGTEVRSLLYLDQKDILVVGSSISLTQYDMRSIASSQAASILNNEKSPSESTTSSSSTPPPIPTQQAAFGTEIKQLWDSIDPVYFYIIGAGVFLLCVLAAGACFLRRSRMTGSLRHAKAKFKTSEADLLEAELKVDTIDLMPVQPSAKSPSDSSWFNTLRSAIGRYASATAVSSASGTLVAAKAEEISIPAFLNMRWGLDFRQDDMYARGGGGTIYHCSCFDTALEKRSGGRPLVVKSVDANIEELSDRTRKAFYQELALMWRFRDLPGVVKVYAYSLHPATFVLRFYEYGNLKVYAIKRRSKPAKAGYKLTMSRLVSVFKKLCDALSYMHEAGVVHCDVKSANVLLDVAKADSMIERLLDSYDDGQVPRGLLIPVVTDFGLSRIIDEDKVGVAGYEMSTVRGASTSYAAPEVFERFNHGVTTFDPQIWKSGDVYALAICLHELLTRSDPWKLNF